MTIQSDVALYFARQFRAARAQVQRDAEGYVAVAIAVEQLGAALGAKDGMYEAQKVIVNTLSLDSDWTHGDNGSPSLGSAYDRVRRARNIAVHEGAMSRAVGAHAIDLTIGLEVALMKAVRRGHWVVAGRKGTLDSPGLIDWAHAPSWLRQIHTGYCDGLRHELGQDWSMEIKYLPSHDPSLPPVRLSVTPNDCE